MSPLAKILGGIFSCVVGVVATIVVSSFTNFSALFYGAVIVGLVMIVVGIFQLISRGMFSVFPQLHQCRIGTDAEGNYSPVVLIPIQKAERTFGGNIPPTLLHNTTQQQMLADVIQRDLYRAPGRLPHVEQIYSRACDITKWLDLSVLNDDNGKASHLCVVFDDGSIAAGDSQC